MLIQGWATSRWNDWITKRIPRAKELSLHQRQLFIFPSRSGLALLGLLLVLLLVAINYENNLVFGLVFLLATVIVITVHLTFANLYRITISGMHNTPVFAGETGAVALRLTAHSHPRYDISFASSDAQGLVPHVEPAGSAKVAMAVKPCKRGLFALGRLRVESDYPFGLVRCWSWVDVCQPLWVYPRPVTPPLAEHSDVVSMTKRRLSPSRLGDDLYGFSSYRPGDPIKHIHWPSVARGADPQVTVLANDSGDNPLAINFDDYPGVDLEMRLSWLCARVIAASRENLSYSLILPSGSIGPNSGTDHREAALMMLAQFEWLPESRGGDDE
jgi:uncharacterized protein (DUF58 family)